MQRRRKNGLSWRQLPLYPLHYWLRPIEGVQFRFDNFGSHFIRVQIFQIDFSTLLLILSASKYFRLILKRPNEHFSISLFNLQCICQTTQEGKGTSWSFLNDPNIWLRHLVQGYLENNICYFRSPISLWTGPQLKSLFWAFFLSMVFIFTM